MHSGEYGSPGSNGGHGLIGRAIGGYTLERELGTGGAGVVFLGQKVDNATELAAVKVLMLPPQSSAEERAEFRSRFLQEAQLLFQLRHPHILPIYAFGEDQATSYAYMVLPYLEGGPFTNRLQRGPLPLDVVARYAVQAAAALDFAHTRGIVHRDVKPANLLLDNRDQLFLADFGIARLFDPVGGGLTTTGRVLGTAAYMSPEQALGHHAGPAADVYSLGIVLYQCVTGRVPFDGPTQTAVMVQHIQQPPPSPRALRPDLPPPAEAAILRALAKRPEERFPSAGALVYAFSEGIQGRSPQMPYAPVPGTESTVQDYQARSTQMAPQPPNVTMPGSFNVRRPRGSFPPIGVAALVVVVIAVLILVLANMSNLTAAMFGNKSPNTPTSTITPGGSTAPASTSPTAQNSGALVAAGNLIYTTSAPGLCDSSGGNWEQNPSAVQTCGSGGLILAGPSCPCPLGVVALASIQGQPYPQSYVVQVHATLLSSDSTAFYGLKFRQQSLQDTSQGRGGYAFLFAQNGQWEYNQYDSDGTRHILSHSSLPFAVNASTTLDLVVNGADFSFYLNGQLISQQSDSTYGTGYLCLVAEPGAKVLFQNLAVYGAPS
ncbi:MAG TPA: protein kinase [Ktedonobacterales bacterium]|jgi:serine/threonine protein kinase|nr:protein kinase [Ktedonobacterales bacterium]